MVSPPAAAVPSGARPPFVALVHKDATTAWVDIENHSRIVDTYRLAVHTDHPGCFELSSESVSLFPGSSARERLTFTDPKAADIPPGPLPVAVSATSTVDGEMRSADETSFPVAAFTSVTPRLGPISPGRFRRKVAVDVHLDNRGNRGARLLLMGEGVDLSFDGLPRPIDVPAGTCQTHRLILRADHGRRRGDEALPFLLHLEEIAS